jgi:hypothetical protein
MAEGMNEASHGEKTSDGEISGKWHHVPSAHAHANARNGLTSRKVHRVGAITTAVVSGSVSAAGNAKHLTMIGVGGAAVMGAGTAGIGLLVAGGVMSAVNMGTSAASAYKTNKHLNALAAIRSGGSANERCMCISNNGASGVTANDHEMIYATILPYIISKKRTKLVKKGVGATGLSMLTSMQRIGKAAYKSLNHTKGVARSYYAHVLARHALTHDCWLAQQIISELYSPQDYVAISMMGSEDAGELIAAKMKSV